VTARRLLVIGAGAHARAVADLAQACGWTLAGFLGAPGGPSGRQVIGSDDDLAALVRDRRLDAAIVGVGNTALSRRAELFAGLRRLGVATPSLLHPSAVVSPSAKIGDGTVVFPNVVIGADAEVGANAVIYSGSVLEHDCRLGHHVYLSPAVILCGDVQVDEGAFVGAGAVVIPGVRIGRMARVDALVRVVTDVSDGMRMSVTPSITLGRS